jgi:hypothetical protein
MAILNWFVMTQTTGLKHGKKNWKRKMIIAGRKYLKMHPAFKLVLGLIIIAFIFSIFPREQYLWINPFICTKLANDSIPQNFNKLKIGMDKDSIKKIIGTPIRTAEWYNKGDSLFSDKYSVQGASGWAWIEFAVYYKKENKITIIANYGIRND